MVEKRAIAVLDRLQRGRGGGVQLGVPSVDISIGAVIRAFEGDFAVVDCLNPDADRCAFLPKCALKPAIMAATDAFLSCLDDYTLAMVIKGTQMPRT